MITRNPIALQFEGEVGENITVGVSAHGSTKFLITYAVNGQIRNLDEGDQINFTLNGRTRLVIQMGFQPKDGTGAYTVSIRGDREGFPFRRTFSGRFGVDILEKPFTFFV